MEHIHQACRASLWSSRFLLLPPAPHYTSSSSASFTSTSSQTTPLTLSSIFPASWHQYAYREKTMSVRWFFLPLRTVPPFIQRCDLLVWLSWQSHGSWSRQRGRHWCGWGAHALHSTSVFYLWCPQWGLQPSDWPHRYIQRKASVGGGLTPRSSSQSMYHFPKSCE